MKLRAMIVALATSLLAGGCFAHPNDTELPGQTALGDDGYTVTATFDSVDNLVPNSTVQQDDVVIGTVTDISVEDWAARVTMRLSRDVSVPANATFAIGQKTLLGAQFIDVVDPADPQGTLEEGSTVAQDVTGLYPGTEQILSAVSLLLNNGGLSQISTITSELNTTLANRVPQARDTVVRLNELTTTLSQRRGDIVATLETLDSFSAQVAAQQETVAAAVTSIGPGIGALESQRDNLVGATASLGTFSTVATQLVNTSQEALLANLGALEPVLADLDAAGAALPQSLDFLVTLPFPVSSTRNALRGDFANLFLTLDVSLPALTSAFLGPDVADPPSLTAADGASSEAEALALPQGLTDLLPPGPTAPQAAGPSAPTPQGGAGPSPQSAPATPCNILSVLLGAC